MRKFTLSLLALGLTATAAVAGPPQPATDARVAEIVRRAADRRDLPAGPAVVLLDEADVYVEPSGLALTRRRRVVRIQAPAGIKAFTVLREGFDPNTNRVSLDRVRIHRRDGDIDEVDTTARVVQPARQGRIFWGNRQQLLAMPRLSVGDSLEICSSRIGYNIAYLGGEGAGLSGDGLEPPMPGHWYEVTRFEEGRPVLTKRYSVHLPKEMPVQFEVFGGPLRTSLWSDGHRRVYTFVAENVPAFRSEPHRPSRDDCVVKLVMATLPDWESKSRWFFRVNESRLEADEAIRAKVAEITAGLNDEEARIAACLHWVADNIRYLGTSRGPTEGFTLHPSVETFRDRAGVCKDIAGMLITMLRVMGVEAYPALTMAGPRVEDIPADQFNHTVAAIRHADGSFQVLDPTWSPVSRELWSSREAEQGLVYGTPEGRGLTLSPFFPAEANAVRLVARSRIAGNGTLATRPTMTLCGYPGTYLRRNLDRHHPDRRAAAVAEHLRLGPSTQLLGFTATAPRDYSEDARLSLAARARGYAAAGDDVLLFKLAMLQLPLADWLCPEMLWPRLSEKRRFPLRLRATRLLEFREQIHLPPGFEPVVLPAKKRIDTPSASVLFDCRFADGVLSYTFRFVARKHLVPVEELPGFQRTLDAWRELAEFDVLCRRKGGGDAR